MTDWSRESLTATADAIAAGRTTSRDVTEASLDRIERLAEFLNCFVEIDRKGACAAADAADRRRRDGAPLGPLHGVPLAHKDMYYRAGRVSACGSKLRADWRAAYTATALEKLDRAGAIELGRLVMVEFAMGPHGYNQNYPQCRNPWNPQHIPCGSSSGSGVAVGGRMVHAVAGLGYGRLDSLPRRGIWRRRPRADLWTGQPPWRDADVALVRRRRPAGPDRARLRAPAGRHCRPRSGRRQLA